MKAGLILAAASLGFGVCAAHAGTMGNAPWCAVQSLGDGDVEWDCEFRTVEECVPNVIAGNRGFCNINPSWTGYPAVLPHHYRKRRHV